MFLKKSWLWFHVRSTKISQDIPHDPERHSIEKAKVLMPVVQCNPEETKERVLKALQDVFGFSTGRHVVNVPKRTTNQNVWSTVLVCAKWSV
jgi:hypothetical protein